MLSHRLQMRQSQSLALTPQLLQSIRLLQYSHVELDAFVSGEIERNPLLSRAPDGDGAPDGGEAFPADAAASPAETGEASLALAGGIGSRAASGNGGGEALSSAIDRAADARPSLALHVLAELDDGCSDPLLRRVGAFLAGFLDEAGYLDCDLDAAPRDLGLARSALDAALVSIQDAVEPAGLFARGLADCLAIQLRRRNRFDPVIGAVLDNLELLARRDFASLKRLTGEDEAGLLDILAEIRSLDPKPGHGFAATGQEGVVPDVVVAAAADGGWTVELSAETLPRVLLDETYSAQVAPLGQAPGEDRAFLAECLASANWLVRSLDQRAKTILKVATEIVRRQDEFLLRGVSGLKPMTLGAVAEAIGMHESTVSRVTANKYVATPRGTFEMKFFFTVAIASSAGGEAHSAESVKHRIRGLVDAERASAVLSDDDIAAALKREGIDLARRTVAKYREALGIPSSVQRRREMNARRLAS